MCLAKGHNPVIPERYEPATLGLQSDNLPQVTVLPNLRLYGAATAKFNKVLYEKVVISCSMRMCDLQRLRPACAYAFRLKNL